MCKGGNPNTLKLKIKNNFKSLVLSYAYNTINFWFYNRLPAKLISAFVFTYADCWFSHVAAHLYNTGTVMM